MLKSTLYAHPPNIPGDRSKSEALEISNSVYQGVVFGPTLWNIFFQEVSIPVHNNDCEDFQYADDNTVSRVYPRASLNDDIIVSMKECQVSCHQWGAEHRIVFDKSKEFFMVLSAGLSDHSGGFGEPFKNLGVLMDSSLLMDDYISNLVNRCNWQISIFSRCVSFFSECVLVDLYKAYLLPVIEYGIPAYFHCCPSRLSKIDAIQNRFLSLLRIAEDVLLLKYNLAPLCYRRRWAIFGLLFKIAERRAPRLLNDMFTLQSDIIKSSSVSVSTRSSLRKHRLALCDPRMELTIATYGVSKDLDIFIRSIFGQVSEFNKIAPEIIDNSPTVHIFQRKLQAAYKEKIRFPKQLHSRNDSSRSSINIYY